MGTAHTQQQQGAALPSLAPIFTDRMRPLRFVGAGLLAGAVQLSLLALLLHWNWPAVPANLVAFVVSTEINFLCNAFFTWHDRRGNGSRGRFWLVRWGRFHSAIAGTAVLNQGLFLLLHLVWGWQPLIASACASSLISVINYFLNNHLVFRTTS